MIFILLWKSNRLMMKSQSALERLRQSTDRPPSSPQNTRSTTPNQTALCLRQLDLGQSSNPPHSVGPCILRTQPSGAAPKILAILPPSHSNSEDRRYKRRLVLGCTGRWSRLMPSNCDTQGIRTERNARMERQRFPQKLPQDGRKQARCLDQSRW